MEKHLNCRAMQCPGPIMELFKTVKAIESGDTVVIEVTDEGFKKDVAAWCKKTGNELVSLEEKDGVITAKVKKS
jgi:tRNA 2-thiouridine synthesizing protein A